MFRRSFRNVFCGFGGDDVLEEERREVRGGEEGGREGLALSNALEPQRMSVILRNEFQKEVNCGHVHEWTLIFSKGRKKHTQVEETVPTKLDNKTVRFSGSICREYLLEHTFIWQRIRPSTDTLQLIVGHRRFHELWQDRLECLCRCG